jgi:hypothetical protein
MRGGIPPLPQYAFMAWCLVKLYVTLRYFMFSLFLGYGFSSLILITLNSIATLLDTRSTGQGGLAITFCACTRKATNSNLAWVTHYTG